jgi:glycogen operon protein
VLWLTPQATEMTEADWNFPEGRFLSYVLGPVQAGQSPLFIVLNAAAQEIELTLPTLAEYGRWLPVLDTVNRIEAGKEHAAGSKAVASSRSVLVFSGEI